MNYLELLKFVLPEAAVTATALIGLALGLTRPNARTLHSLVAAVGLLLAMIAVVRLPHNAGLPNGLLVITPLTSLFKIICLLLALFTVLLARRDTATARHRSEYLAMILL